MIKKITLASLLLSVLTITIIAMDQDQDKANQEKVLNFLLQSNVKKALDVTNLDRDSKNLITQYVANDWQIHKILKDHRNIVDQLSIANDRKLLLSCDLDGVAKIWDIEKDIIMSNISQFVERWSRKNLYLNNNKKSNNYSFKKASSIIFSSPGQNLKFVYYENKLLKYEADIYLGNGGHYSINHVPFNINYIIFSNNGNYLVYGNNRIMEIKHIIDDDNECFTCSMPAQWKLNNSQAIVPYQDNNFIIACENGLFKIMPQLSQEAPICYSNGYVCPGIYKIDSLNYEFISNIKAKKLAISKNNKYLAILEKNKKLSIMDLDSKKIIENLETTKQINTFNFSNDGQYLAIGLFGFAKLDYQKDIVFSPHFKQYASNLFKILNSRIDIFVSHEYPSPPNPYINEKNDYKTNVPCVKIWDTNLKAFIQHSDLYDNCASIIFAPNGIDLFIGLHNGKIVHLKKV